MAYSPISFIASNYRDYKNNWLKAYEPGTTTPKAIATDSTLSTLISKAELNKDGFIVSAGQAIIIPHIDSSYDLWLFPTEAEADANDTSGAVKVADNMIGINGDILIDYVGFNFDTLNAALSETNESVIKSGAALNLAGRQVKNDGGGAVWDVYPANTFPTNQIVVNHTTLPLQLVMRLEGELNVQQWGLPGVSQAENAAIVDEICDYAYSVGTMAIRCDVDATVDPSAIISNKSNVIFYGNGSLTGLYRVIVHKTQDSRLPVINNIKQTQLDVFHRAANPVVVSMGDSISTGGGGGINPAPNGVSYGESMWSVITKKIQNDIPHKDFSFINRGIGGQTWLNANDNTRPSVGIAYWYTEDKPWLDYVEDLKPDLLFLAFGMNDSNGFNSGAMVSTINKINAWDKVPSIVFITTPVPSLATIYPDGTGFGFVGSQFQEGRDQVATYTRSYAEFYDYGYVDINRVMTCVRDGYDNATSNMSRVETDVVPPSGAYTNSGGAGARDFSITGEIKGTATEIEAILNGDNGVVTCRIGFSSSDLVFINSSGDGTIQLQLNATGLGSYKVVQTGFPFPTQDFTLTVDVTNNVLTVLVDNLTIGTHKVIRKASLFPVQFGYQGFATGPFSLITFNKGVSESVGKSATDSEIWGPSDLTADTKLPKGGNGINHYAAGGIAKVVVPAFEMTNFSGYEQDSKEISPYPLTTNEHFINWTGTEIDSWGRQANFGTETVGGVHGSPTSVTFVAYPCGYAQNVTPRMSRELAKYKLIVVAKGGSLISNKSAGYVNPHSTMVIVEYNDGAPQSKTIHIKETLFGADWESAEFDLEKLAGIDFPPLSEITKVELRIYMNTNSVLGYAGIHEADSANVTYHNPLLG